MTDRSWRVVATIVATVLALVAGAIIAFVVLPGSPVTPSAAVSLAVASPSRVGPPSASESVSASQSLLASASPSASRSPSPSATRPTPTPSPTPKPAPVAALTITQLKLDPRQPAGAGVPRYISFTSDGPGTITAQLKAITSSGTTHMCLRANLRLIKCVDASATTITAHAASAHVNWRVGLQGTDTSTPTVEVTVTFPAFAPSVKITHARFDGMASPETNGLQALFVPRKGGLVRMVADWGGHPFMYEIDVTNQSSGTGNTTFANQGPSTNADASVHVTSGETWKLVLQNSESGFGPTDMTARISWP
jgi:hypothetical protein